MAVEHFRHFQKQGSEMTAPNTDEQASSVVSGDSTLWKIITKGCRLSAHGSTCCKCSFCSNRMGRWPSVEYSTFWIGIFVCVLTAAPPTTMRWRRQAQLSLITNDVAVIVSTKVAITDKLHDTFVPSRHSFGANHISVLLTYVTRWPSIAITPLMNGRATSS